MITGFLIATLVLFILNLALSLLTISVNAADPDNKVPVVSIVSVFINLIMITWNILALISL